MKFVGGASFQGNITLGDHVVIGTNSNFMSTGAKIEIGNSVLFGPHIFIITGNHQINQIGKCIIDVEKKTECCDADVVIEDDVWIGAGTIVLKRCANWTRKCYRCRKHRNKRYSTIQYKCWKSVPKNQNALYRF